tara:strand:+ start:4526 stop:5719 length:1194 start_codon:yes stop_codon:yes gene_type:complete
MSYNGTGTFNINSAGQPVVTGTTITSTAFNLLTTDLATGLTTALTKDGQTTPTANIPMGTFKITGLGAGSATTDAAQYGQLQANATTIATVTGTDTLVGSLAPALTAYATGNLFSFVAVNTNTGATTININSLGAKNITKLGTTALAAGDIVSGQVHLIEYDGTRFQLINPAASFVSTISFGSTGLTPSTATGGAVSVAGILVGTNGGTGVNNGSSTITIAGNVTHAGAFTQSFTATATTALTLPTTGTLSTLAGSETLTNKTLTSPTLTTPALGTPSSGQLSSCTVDGTNKVGYLNIPNSGAKTSSYTLVVGDVGKFIELGTGGSVVVPASVFAAGDAISIFNNTSATISCTCSAVTDVYKGGIDTDISTFSVTTRGVVTILFITATRAVVTGNLA